jgi:hypothetical protein
MSVPRFPAKSITFRDETFALLQTRSFNSLSMNTVNFINMVTIDPRFPPRIVGSFKYIVNEYPADIDVMEIYESCCSVNEAAKDVTSKFQDIALRLKNAKDVYLGDFKAGYDYRYKIDIGYIKAFKKGFKLSGYNPVAIESAILKLNSLKLNTNDETAFLLQKLIPNPTILEYSDLESAIRKKYIIRWTLDELLKGSKILFLNKKIDLEDAIQHNSVIKIDIWVYLNQRYLEITNYYTITFKDKTNNIGYLSIKLEKYEDRLQKDLRHLNNPNINRYMKLSKRLWSYAVLNKNKRLMISLYPLFSSGAAKMHQIVGEIDVILNILEKVKVPPLTSIIENIESWKTRLGTVMSDILPHSIAYIIYEKINIIIKKKNNTDVVLVILKEISDKLTQYINRYVKLYFKKNEIIVEKYLLKK